MKAKPFKRRWWIRSRRWYRWNNDLCPPSRMDAPLVTLYQRLQYGPTIVGIH